LKLIAILACLPLSLFSSMILYAYIYPHKYIVIVDVAVLKDSTMSFPLEFDYVRISTEWETKRQMMTISHSMESAAASVPFRK
jgi:hypothetical protein